MNDRFDKLENKLDKLDVHLGKIDITLARNTTSLEHHIERQSILEEHIKKELPPLKDHMLSINSGLKAVMWFCVGVSGVAGFIYTLLKIFQ